LLLAPATRLVRVLNEPASAFARLLKAKGEASPPPAASPAPEAKTEETPEAKQEAPMAETKEEAPAAEPIPATAAKTPTAESTTGETGTESPV
jgi:hypothetical protein